MTTAHRIGLPIVFFFGQTSTTFETDEYLALTYVCNHLSDTPVTLYYSCR